MAPSTTSPATNALPPNVQVIFRDDPVQPELRRLVERSVATMATRTEEEFTKRRAVEAERARLLAALNAQRREQREPDPELVKAFEDMGAHPLIDPGSRSAARPEPPQPAANPLGEFLGLGPVQVEGSSPIEITVAPKYHYFWSWGNPFGGAVGGTGSVSGFVGLDTRSGSIDGGSSCSRSRMSGR